MIALAGVSSVGGSSTAELMKVLENAQQATVDLAEKLIKMTNSSKVAESEATGLGKMVDLYA